MLNTIISWNFVIILLILVALSLLAKKFHNSHRGPLRQYNNDLRGKIIIITGCSAGIGKETARYLAKLGGTIIFANRNQQKSDIVMKEIQDQTKNNNLHFIRLDTSDYQSVHHFAQEFLQRFNKLDILINNAGTAAYGTTYNKDGHETVIATNHLGHFLLTNLLLKTIVNTKQSRVINVSSKAINSVKKLFDLEQITTNCQNQRLQYPLSKACNVFFTNELQNKFEEHKVDSKTVSLHPGVVKTEIFDKVKMPLIFRWITKIVFILLNWYFLSEEEGAMTTIYTALIDYNELSPSGYYSYNALSSATQFIRNNNELQKQVWMTSEKLVNIKSNL